jgi:hypothetical protein
MLERIPGYNDDAVTSDQSVLSKVKIVVNKI